MVSFWIFTINISSTLIASSIDASISPCFQSGSYIVVTIRVNKNGTVVSQLTAYDHTGLIAQNNCSMSSNVADDFIQLSITFDPASPTCGIQQSGTVYNIQVHAIGPGLNQPYKFSCDSASLSTMDVNAGPLAVKGRLPIFALYERHRSLQLEAVTEAGVPADKLELGQAVQLRIIYDRGEKETDGTWGYYFHTGFLKTSPSDDLVLQIYAEDLGTRVRIMGNLAGFERNHVIYVPSGYPVTYKVPRDYHPSSTPTGWITEMKGLKIVSLDHRIGVNVTSNIDLFSPGSGVFIAASDNILGTSYRLPTSTASDAQVLVIGTANGTNVILTYDDFTTAGITVDGVARSAGSDTVVLNEFETLHLICGLSCKGISVTSSMPVAVITGKVDDTVNSSGINTGHMITQVPPTSQFGTRFILFNVRSALSTTTSYLMLAETPIFNGAPYTYYTADGSFAFDDGSGNELELTASSDPNAWSAEEMETDTPVLVTQFTTTGNGYTISIVPHIHQWTTTQTLPLHHEMAYDIVIVTTIGVIDTLLICVANDGPVMVVDFCFGSSDTFGVVVGLISPSIRQDVTSITGSPKYEFLVCQMHFPNDIQWLKVEGSDNNDRFWMMAFEHDPNHVNSHNSFGLKYSDINNCIPSTTQAANIPVYHGLIRGDGKDNDCDGRVDEELLNGLDDDGDGLIDEDLVSERAVEFLDPYAVSCTRLEISSSNTFPASATVTLIDNGCIANGEPLFPSSSHFKATSALISKYPSYWILQTDVFPVFRFRNTPSVFFRATVDFCASGSGLCLDSCSGGKQRKRRQSSGRKRSSVLLRVDIKDATTPNPDTLYLCEDESVCWSLIIALLIVAITEMVVIATLYKLKQTI